MRTNLKRMYSTALNTSFPEIISIIFGDKEIKYQLVKWDNFRVRYGTNPHQPCAFYRPLNDPNLSIGNVEFLKMGKEGPSLTNLQDMSQALNILKYFLNPSVAVMKHLNPSGFATSYNGKSLEEVYTDARDCDKTAAFGSVVGFNTSVDKTTAEALMSTFVEAVIAPDYEEGVINTLSGGKTNKNLRVAKVSNLDKIPKFDGDDYKGYMQIKVMADGSLAFEVPYLTSIKSKDDLELNYKDEKEGKLYEVKRLPSEEEIRDMLTAWYVTINVRSNAIVFVKDGITLAVGTGQQDRIRAIEQAAVKANRASYENGEKYGLEGAVMASDGFLPFRDSIDKIANEGVTAVIFPAGSIRDYEIIEAANERNIALAVTGERCFLHI